MLDNILNTVRQGVEKVQRRGEEVTQVARLRVEVFQLGRELDSHFARLGRAYHSGAAADLLHGIREDIRRVEADIESREHLIAELGEAGDAAPEAASTDLAPTPADSARARLSQNLAAERQGQQPGTAAPADQPRGEPVRPIAEQDVPSSTASQPSASNRPAFVDEANDQTKG
ncbi:hypothetical protein ACTQ9L_02830 [Deinococcus wulumuqiensis]